MKRNIVIAAVTAAALVGGGTAAALATSGDDDARETTRQASDVRPADDDTVRTQGDTDAAAARTTVADALAAALRDTPGTAVSADLDGEDDDGDDGGRAAWEVDVLSGDGTWHSVRVDPATGKVLGSHPDDEDDDTAEVRTALKGASVDAAGAAKAAATHGTVTSVELDDDGDDGNGSAAWEVETRTDGKAGEQDWRVDLKTGKVKADHSHAADSGSGSGSDDGGGGSDSDSDSDD